MKTMGFRLICLLALLSPVAAASQTIIKSAFEAIIKCPEAEIEESHGLNKDRNTNIKTGQYDSYTFVLPAGKSNLIKNVLRAFDTDKDKAYVVKTGKNLGTKNMFYLYAGDDESSIPIDDPGYDYIYEFFAPSKQEDPDGSHRYAYAFNYTEKDGKIMGRMVISYATTAEYREKELRAKQLGLIADIDKGEGTSAVLTNGNSWFEQMMACIIGMKGAPQKTRIALATKAYNLVREIDKFPDVTPMDKTTVLRVLRPTIEKADDPISAALLSQCEAGIH